MVAKVSEFYQYAIHLVYAIIIASSYDVAIRLFIPIQNFWTSYDTILNGIALLFAYIIVISGWVGWTKSIQNKPHKITFFGNSRFVLDLFIGFWYFYLIQLAIPEHFGEFNQVFVWVNPVIFGVYVVWDLVKFKEYNFKNQEKIIRTNRATKTIYFFIIFMMISYAYTLVEVNEITIIAYENDIVDLIFILGSIGFTLWYRKSKWKETKTKRRRKITDSKKKNNSNTQVNNKNLNNVF